MIILMAVLCTLIALMPTTECKALYPKLAIPNDLISTRPTTTITTTTRISPDERRKLSFFPKNPTRYTVTERSKITTEMVDTKKPTILPKTHVLITSKTSLDKPDINEHRTTRSPLLKFKVQTTQEPAAERVITIKEKIIENTPELYESIEYDSEEVISSEIEHFEENSNESDGSEILESDESDLLAVATSLKEESIDVNTNNTDSNATSNLSSSYNNKLYASEKEKKTEDSTSNILTVQGIKENSKHKLKRSIIEDDIRFVTVVGYYIPAETTSIEPDLYYSYD